jgi:hypothetical protein
MLSVISRLQGRPRTYRCRSVGSRRVARGGVEVITGKEDWRVRLALGSFLGVAVSVFEDDEQAVGEADFEPSRVRASAPKLDAGR